MEHIYRDCQTSTLWQRSNAVRSRCNLLTIADGHEITAKYLTKWGSEMLRRPLGCAYDSAKNYCLVADSGNHQVRVLDNRIFKESFSVCGLYRPSAVVMLEEARTFGMLDSRYISIFDYRSSDSTLVSERLWGNHRGISFNIICFFSNNGNLLVTIKRVRPSLPKILFYDFRRTGEPLQAFEYDIDSVMKGSLPSFVDCFQNLLVISDLGIRAVYVMAFGIESEKMDQMFPHSWLSLKRGNFVYPSGVCFDANGSIIVSDAGTRKLYWFNSKININCEITVDDGFCYGSGMCVTAEGELIVCGRRSNELKFYQLKKLNSF